MRARIKTHDIILGTGIFLVVAGIAMLLCIALKVEPNMLIVIPVGIIILGAICLFASYTRNKLVWRFFLGYFLTAAGFFSLVVSFSTLTPPMKKMWPIFVILCGVSYFVASFQCRKKLYASILVPTVGLIALGGMFLVFSLGIANVSFRYFVAQWWPVFVVLLGIILIIVYVYMQHSYNADNSTNKVIADSDDDD